MRESDTIGQRPVLKSMGRPFFYVLADQLRKLQNSDWQGSQPKTLKSERATVNSKET